MLEAKIYLDDASEAPLLATFLDRLQAARKARYALQYAGTMEGTEMTTAAEPDVRTPSSSIVIVPVTPTPTPADPPRTPPPGPSKARGRKPKPKQEAADDVPPVPLENALEEIDANATAANAPTSTEADAIAAMQAAVARGVPLPEIVALLAERKVARVTQLSPEDRATFVAALS